MSNTGKKVRICANLLRISTYTYTHARTPDVWKYCSIHLFLCFSLDFFCFELRAHTACWCLPHIHTFIYPSATAAHTPMCVCVSIVSLDERSPVRYTRYTHAHATELLYLAYWLDLCTQLRCDAQFVDKMLKSNDCSVISTAWFIDHCSGSDRMELIMLSDSCSIIIL